MKPVLKAVIASCLLYGCVDSSQNVNKVVFQRFSKFDGLGYNTYGTSQKRVGYKSDTDVLTAENVITTSSYGPAVVISNSNRRYELPSTTSASAGPNVALLNTYARLDFSNFSYSLFPFFQASGTVYSTGYAVAEHYVTDDPNQQVGGIHNLHGTITVGGRASAITNAGRAGRVYSGGALIDQAEGTLDIDLSGGVINQYTYGTPTAGPATITLNIDSSGGFIASGLIDFGNQAIENISISQTSIRPDNSFVATITQTSPSNTSGQTFPQASGKLYGLFVDDLAANVSTATIIGAIMIGSCDGVSDQIGRCWERLGTFSAKIP